MMSIRNAPPIAFPVRFSAYSKPRHLRLKDLQTPSPEQREQILFDSNTREQLRQAYHLSNRWLDGSEQRLDEAIVKDHGVPLEILYGCTLEDLPSTRIAIAMKRLRIRLGLSPEATDAEVDQALERLSRPLKKPTGPSSRRG